MSVINQCLILATAQTAMFLGIILDLNAHSAVCEYFLLLHVSETLQC